MKIALCTPCHADPKHDFFVCHSRLINFTKSSVPGLVLEIFTVRSANIFEARELLVDEAQRWGADHILWMDADHTFHPGALIKLLNRQVDVVGAIYRRRSEAIFPVAAIEADRGWVPVLPTAEKARADEMEEVHRIGLGFVLMRMAALAQLPRPLFEGGSGMSEDVALCDKLRAAGVKIHVDHWLSMDLGHIHETVLRFPPKTIAVPIPAPAKV